MVEESMEMNSHEIMMSNRNAMEVTGVSRVESFDSEEFLLQTDYGYLGIRGRDLHIKNLDLDVGRVAIEGQITDISYIDTDFSPVDKSKGLIGRFFR